MEILLTYLKMRAEMLVGEQRGQGALEYIAIVIGIVIIAYLGYRLLGQNLGDEIEDTINTIFG